MVSVAILSPDLPTRVLADLDRQTYQDFEVIHASDRGIVNAMNGALRAARGDIFVRIDDDVRLPNIWLEELIKPFEDPQVAGATGPTDVPTRRRAWRDSIRIAQKPNRFLTWLFDNEPYAPARIYKCGSVSYGSNFLERLNGEDYSIDHLEGTNWAMRTDLIREVGGFDPAYDGVAEWFDDDVVFKVKKLGYKLKYNVNAVVWHLLGESANFHDRREGWSRIKNWLRFHFRHSRFHPKMIIWLGLMIGYVICKKFQS